MDQRIESGVLALQVIRDAAVKHLVDGMSVQYVEQSLALYDREQDIKRLSDEIRKLRAENTDLSTRLAKYEPDTPSL